MTDCDLSEMYTRVNWKKKNEVDCYIKLLDETMLKHNIDSETCIKMCNQLFHNIMSIILDEIKGDVIVETTQSVIDELIKERPTELISRFIKYIYSNQTYRKNILLGNDNFFLEENYSNVVVDGSNENIFQFKNCWGKLMTDTKGIIKKSMIRIVKVTEQYVKCKANIEKLFELRKSICQTLHKSSSSNL